MSEEIQRERERKREIERERMRERKDFTNRTLNDPTKAKRSNKV